MVRERDLGSGRYGRKIAILAIGTWYWSSLLEDISFVPTGRQTSTVEVRLRPSQNTVEGATRAALRASLK